MAMVIEALNTRIEEENRRWFLALDARVILGKMVLTCGARLSAREREERAGCLLGCCRGPCWAAAGLPTTSSPQLFVAFVKTKQFGACAAWTSLH